MKTAEGTSIQRVIRVNLYLATIWRSAVPEMRRISRRFRIMRIPGSSRWVGNWFKGFPLRSCGYHILSELERPERISAVYFTQSFFYGCQQLVLVEAVTNTRTLPRRGMTADY